MSTVPPSARTRLSRVLGAIRRVPGVDGAAILWAVHPEPVVVATDGFSRIPRQVSAIVARAGEVVVTEDGRFIAAEVTLPGPMLPGALLVALSGHAVWDAEEHARLLACAAWAEDVLLHAPTPATTSAEGIEFAPIIAGPATDALVLAWSIDGALRYVSPGFEARSGWSGNEIVGTRSLSLVHPDDVSSAVEAGVEVMANGKHSLVFRLRSSDASYVWVEAELRADQGAGLIWVTAREIDREGRLREQLTTAERRYQHLVSVLREGVLVERRDGVVEAANPAACAALGIPDDLLVGRRMANIATQPDGSPTESPAERTFRAGEPQTDVLFRVLADEGPPRWLSANTSFLDADRVVVSMTDITALKAAQDALAEREARYRTVVHNLHEGIAVFDDEGRVVELNAAAEPVLGLTPTDLRDGARAPTEAEVVDEAGRPIAADELPTAISRRTGTARTDAVLGVRRAGKPLRWYLVSAVPLPGGGTVASLLDYTAIKHARDEMEQRKDEFITTLSHEMRTPLMALTGSISLLQAGAAGEMPPVAAPLLQVARRNADRLVRLVNDVLDLERMIAGSLRLDRQPHDLVDLVRLACDSTRPLGTDLDVQISVSSPTDPIPTLIDADRVQQILANLLSNAIKFSPRGSSVEVRLTANRKLARVTVRDHGPGVPKAVRGQLFSRFWQGQQPALDRRVRGSGLGLSISRALASALGGEVGYEEPAGGGACFWVTFPREGAAP